MILLMLTMAYLSSATATLDSDMQPSPRSGIHGVVFARATGEKIRDATVFLYSYCKIIKEGKTDQEGRYTFQDLPSGDYMVNVLFPGFQDSRTHFKLSVGENLLQNIGVDVATLSGDLPQPSVTATVRQVNGKPLQDVLITVVSGFEQGVLERCVTDREGKCKLWLTGRHLAVIALKEGFNMELKPISSEGIPAGVPTDRSGPLEIILTPLKQK